MEIDPHRLKQAIAAREMNYSSLARAVGAAPHTISELCSGTKNTRKLLEIARALSVSTDWLLGLSDVGGPVAATPTPPGETPSQTGEVAAKIRQSPPHPVLGGNGMGNEGRDAPPSGGLDLQSLVRDLAAGQIDPSKVAGALLASTLLRDEREAADARAREKREDLLALHLSSPRTEPGPGGAREQTKPPTDGEDGGSETGT